MNTDPIARIVGILEKSGYRVLPTPFKVANIPFEFAAVLIGTEKAPDLIVVVDTISEKSERIRQKISGLGRAMDVVRSRRPITAILVGPKPDEATLELISRVCRVLPVGTPVGPSDDQLLRDWLSVLLPLELPLTAGVLADPIGELQNRLPSFDDSGFVDHLIAEAQNGAPAVKEALRRHLSQPVREAIEEVRGEESEA
jgi:hypothetical protein